MEAYEESRDREGSNPLVGVAVSLSEEEEEEEVGVVTSKEHWFWIGALGLL